MEISLKMTEGICERNITSGFLEAHSSSSSPPSPPPTYYEPNSLKIYKRLFRMVPHDTAKFYKEWTFFKKRKRFSEVINFTLPELGPIQKLIFYY